MSGHFAIDLPRTATAASASIAAGHTRTGSCAPMEFSWRTASTRAGSRSLASSHSRFSIASRPSDVNPLHVDHIQPRSTHKHLELVEGNLQVLCGQCNFGKSNTDSTDWRFVVAVDEKRLDESIRLSATEEKTRKELLNRAIKGSTEEEREAAKALYAAITKYEWGMFKEREKGENDGPDS